MIGWAVFACPHYSDRWFPMALGRHENPNGVLYYMDERVGRCGLVHMTVFDSRNDARNAIRRSRRFCKERWYTMIVVEREANEGMWEV